MNLKANLFLILVMAVTLTAGCGSGSYDAAGALQEINATNPQKLANLYALYQRKKGGKGPKDQKAFEAFISEISPALLERIDVDHLTVSDLFTSQRDGQPLKIRYGVKGNDRSGPEPVVFETVGVEGVRIVAFTGQKTEQISDEEEYKKLLGNAK